jgi:hypothetical protein
MAQLLTRERRTSSYDREPNESEGYQVLGRHGESHGPVNGLYLTQMIGYRLLAAVKVDSRAGEDGCGRLYCSSALERPQQRVLEDGGRE